MENISIFVVCRLLLKIVLRISVFVLFVLLSLFMFLLFLLGLIVAVVEGGGCGRDLSELRMSICKMGHLSIFVVKG